MNLSSCQSALDAFHELTQKEEQKLEAVFQRVEDGCREVVALKFPSLALVFTADPDTDTIEVRCQDVESFALSELNCVNALSPWSVLIGKPFGWGWVTINQQGYQDGVLLSFDGLEPSVMLLVAASSLQVYSLKEMTN